MTIADKDEDLWNFINKTIKVVATTRKTPIEVKVHEDPGQGQGHDLNIGCYDDNYADLKRHDVITASTDAKKGK